MEYLLKVSNCSDCLWFVEANTWLLGIWWARAALVVVWFRLRENKPHLCSINTKEFYLWLIWMSIFEIIWLLLSVGKISLLFLWVVEYHRRECNFNFGLALPQIDISLVRTWSQSWDHLLVTHFEIRMCAPFVLISEMTTVKSLSAKPTSMWSIYQSIHEFKYIGFEIKHEKH